jgi:Flp pilus assembly protein TadG
MLTSMKPPIKRSLSRLVRDETGAIAVTFALLLIPMILVVGGAVDYARMVQYRASLQYAVDQAALAGAAVFSDSTQSTAATQVATNYFNRSILPSSLSVTAPAVSTNTNGTINPAVGTAAAYTVTVSATAKVSTTLLSLIIPSVTITATGTAGDPVVTPNLGFTNVNSRACDGNSVYLYKVPLNANGTGYDYSAVPAWTKNGSVYTNYYMIGSSYQSVPSGQTLPSMTANQPMGVALVNVTDGNTSNSGCGVNVTGANSYGAPYMSTQTFYSSLLLNNQSPSENTNTSYTVTVTSTSNGNGNGSTITKVTNGTVNVPLSSGSYNTLSSYLGINASSGQSNCTSTASTTGSTTTTVYTCSTQYLTTKTSTTPNCSLYVQTGVTASYTSGLSDNSTAPSAALSKCFSTSGGGAAYAAPSCSQLSALSSSTGSSAIAPAAVFWWDDAGGVGPGEQYYSPSSHCSATSSGGPGYGEDCQYKNNFFAETCTVTGGGTSGYTEVVLTQ